MLVMGRTKNGGAFRMAVENVSGVLPRLGYQRHARSYGWTLLTESDLQSLTRVITK